MRLETWRSNRGFTLIEILFVLAIVAVLAGVLLPMAISSLADSEKAKVQTDQDAIAAALTAFRKDVNYWPDGRGNNVEYLLVGTSVANGVDSPIDRTGQCPTEATASFFATTACGASTATHNAQNHLGINNPDGDTTVDENAEDYRTAKWRGPYLTKFGPDPFGRAYVVYMKGIDKKQSPTTERGWILSAGPNGTLETTKSDTAVSGDDIGFIFCTKCE
jgi:prepilin-type N-terminal cleavage/methylation domain-containing protein